ncbi:MAG: LCP family protein [Microgenomates group bacterium]
MKKVLLIILGIFFGYLVFLAFKTNQVYKKIRTNNSPLVKKNNYNFLIFGYGGGNHEGTYLTDTIMVFHIDTKNKKASIVSIPRDLWVKIPTVDNEDFYTKINAVYQMELYPQNYPNIDKKVLGAKNDANLVKTVIENIFRIKIDGYVAVDFEGFKKIIDSLGGVDVVVEKSFIDTQYPIEGKEKDLCNKEIEDLFKKAQPILDNTISLEEKNKLLEEDKKLDEFVKNATSSPELAFPCRYERLVFQKGLTHMDGETALKFARSRHSGQDGGDFARARRQHQVIEAIKNKLISFDIIAKAPRILDQLKDHLRTDLSIQDMIKTFSKEAPLINEYKLTTFVFSNSNFLMDNVSEDGQYILIPKQGLNNWQEIQQAMQKIFLGIDPLLTPSPTSTITVTSSVKK